MNMFTVFNIYKPSHSLKLSLSLHVLQTLKNGKVNNRFTDQLLIYNQFSVKFYRGSTQEEVPMGEGVGATRWPPCPSPRRQSNAIPRRSQSQPVDVSQVYGFLNY